jgi:transposase
MEVIHPRCAGLDVHKDTVVASARLAAGSEVRVEVQTFATTTTGLLALSAWLAERGCTHVAMEATGVYWKPVWHILADGDFTLVLANAAHVRNLPGRKTDVADATWLAELLAHGLIRASFVPDAPTQALRALLRTRKQLVRERASHVQRLQKTLEDANVKLASVLTDVTGTSGRAIIEAMIAGESDPERLATLAHRRVKAPPGRLAEALRGRPTAHHRFLLRLHLRQIEFLEAAVAEIDQEVEAALAPFRAAVRLLSSIPGVSTLSAEVIVAEIGTDMRRFPTAAHLVSWAGLCPRSDESAGKRRSTRLCLGGGSQEGQPPPGAVPPLACPPRPEEGHLRRRRLDPHRRLAHAPRRHLLPGPRAGPFQPPNRERQVRTPRPAPHQPRIHRPAASTTGPRLTRFPVRRMQ